MTELAFETYRNLGAMDLRSAYKTGELSPVEVTRTALEAISRINPKINAVFHVDEAGALEQARASETRWRNGQPAGGLDGVPSLIKDGLLMKGVPVFRGTIALENQPLMPEEDAPCVARLREDGAILLGKTTMCDLGMLSSGYSSKFGPTRNPWDLSKTSGGSTSGSSAALAAGLVPIAIGTDIVGSVRVPASFCGLSGLKPSYGRVPFYPNSSPAAVAGPMARNVEDMALLMSTIVRPDGRDFTALPETDTSYHDHLRQDFQHTRIGYLRSIGFGPETDPEVSEIVASALDHLRDIGCQIEEIAPVFSQEDGDIIEDFYRHRPYSELNALSDEARCAAEVMDAWSQPAGDHSGQDHYHQFLKTQQVRDQAHKMIAPFDFIVMPTTPMPAYEAELPTAKGQSNFGPFANTLVFNLSEQPAISVNCGFTKTGLPVGFQLIAKRYQDLAVIRLAYAFERALDAAPLWPNLE